MSEMIFMALSTFGQSGRQPLDLLESSGIPFRLHTSGKRITPEELARDAKDATIVLAGVESYGTELLSRLPLLRCISRCGVGVDAIDLEEARRRSITVANTPTIPTEAVAELALAMMLALSRNFKSYDSRFRARRWERIPAHLLEGRTVGLFGLGRIGGRVASLCQAFGARVLAHDPRLTGSSPAGITIVDREHLLREADIVSVHASRNQEQPVLIGRKEFAIVKPGAILINLARGEMVDENALIEALQSGRLSGAGLDVFNQEPYQGPLCDFDNVILTPHAATLTVETRVAMETQCVENALAFLNGTLPPEHRVV